MGEGRWKGDGKLAEFQVLPKENAKFLRWAELRSVFSLFKMES